jgi:cell division protein FtsI (penicillin-binding protein 3)
VLLHAPQVIRRAISPAVAHTMNEMLRSVVDGRDGTAHLARVSDFTVAGKTGTAQIINPATRRYYRDRLVASFVGFLPAEDPKLVILVVLYDVPSGTFGGLVAAPVFSAIASEALHRMAIAPASPKLNVAGLLPISNPIGSLLWPQSGDNDSNLAGANRRVDYGSALSLPEEPASRDSDQKNLRIPELRGLSLRSALAVVRIHRLALRVTGSGYVVDQEPRSGLGMRLNGSSKPETGYDDVQISLADPGENAADHSIALEAVPTRSASVRIQPLAASRSVRRKLAETSLIARREQARLHRWAISPAAMRRVVR